MTAAPADHDLDVAELVPQARHVYPGELIAGDRLFDTGGALQSVSEIATVHDGAAVSVLLGNGHRIWFSGLEPIVAVLPRAANPTITVYERIFDPADEAGWANGDPQVIDTETDAVEWDPEDGNPISWAVEVLDRHGTFEPSSSPPFTERTWYSGTGVDFARSGATVDTSSHLSGFTRAEVEQIGQRITAPPTNHRPSNGWAVGRAVMSGRNTGRRPASFELPGPAAAR